MTGTLLHARSQLVTRAELVTIPPPAATATWRPIAHGDLIQALDRQLLVREITIQKEQFAVQRQGARLFAVLDLATEGNTEEMCAAMGIRTANDRTMALEIAVGTKVLVCDNLAFSGDLIALRRKHTARFDLNADISRAIDSYQHHLLSFRGQVESLTARSLPNEEAKLLIFAAFVREILRIRFFPTVVETYFCAGPGMPDVHPRTWWALHNAFTRTIKQMAPGPAFQATIRLGRLFGLRGNGNGGGEQ
ncbi:MAG: DUF932 domain-containing protein [Candidatus Methylomirabilales bacterium]